MMSTFSREAAYWPISREKYLKIDWSVKLPLHWIIRKFKQIAMAGADKTAGNKFPQK